MTTGGLGVDAGARRQRVARGASWVLLFVTVAAALGAGYAWFALNRTNYYVARNLRGLATLTTQIEAELARRYDLLAIFASDTSKPATYREGDPALPTLLNGFLLLHRTIEPAPANPQLETVEHTLITSGPRPRVEIRSTHLHAEKKHLVRATGVVPLANLHSLFDQSFLSIFDTVFIATPDGKVLEQTGIGQPHPLPALLHSRDRRNAQRLPARDVILTNLGALEERAGWRSWKPLDVRSLRGASRRTEVRVMERTYYLFTHPARFASGSTAARDGPADADLLVGALVPKRTFRLQSLSISDSALGVAAGILIVLLCCYPYVRLAVLPRLAPVRPVDVVLAALGALVGSGVMTVMMADFLVYQRLRETEDDQLARYARKLREELGGDLLRAAVVAEALRDWSREALKKTPGAAVMNLRANVDYWDRREIWQQPYFKEFMWVGADGRSTAIGSADEYPPLAKVSVGGRRFFREAMAGHWWSIVEERRAEPHRIVVDITRAGENPQVVVAVPTNEKDDAEKDKVFAVTTPLIHFIDPVVPPGLGFAVIDQDGVVQFHSEKHRALNENFFKETGDDRHLRSAVYARRDAQINSSYWGIDHQLYVAPMPGTPWTIVALRNEFLLRTINTESVALTSLMLALYAAVYAIAFVLLAGINPKYRVPWLWPDDERGREYRMAIRAAVVELGAAALCIFLLDSWELLWIGFLAPLRGLTTVFLIVNANDRDNNWKIGVCVSIFLTALWAVVALAGDFNPIAAHRLPVWVLKFVLAVLIFAPLAVMTKLGALLPKRVEPQLDDAERKRVFRRYQRLGLGLVLILSVLPAIAFGTVATHVGIDARIKYTQLWLADMLVRRVNLLESLNARDGRIAYDCHESPQVFDSVWTIRPRSSMPRKMSKAETASEQPIVRDAGSPSVRPAWLPKTIQDLLPRYSEGSIALRDLHYDTASDRSWYWLRERYTTTLVKRIRLDEPTMRRFYGNDRSLWTDVNLIIHTPVPLPTLHGQLLARKEDRPTPETLRKSIDCAVPPKDSEVGRMSAVLGLPADPIGVRRPPIIPLLKVIMVIGLLFILIMIPFAAVGFLGRRVFLYNVLNPRWIEKGRLKPGRATHLFIEHQQPAETFADFAQFRVIRLADLVSGETTPEELQLPAKDKPPHRDVLIPDFEEACMSRKFSTIVLAFFEHLVGAGRQSIAVFSRVSVPAVLASLEGEARARWAAVLEHFSRIDESVFDEKWVLPEKLDETSHRQFERLWQDSTVEERLLLYQIARDGLVNEKSAEVLKHLIGRRLVQQQSNVELASEGFEKFVLATGKREVISALERDATPSRWQWVKAGIGVVVIAGALLLFTTQQELVNVTLGIITAIATAVPALLRLIAVLGERPASDATHS